jgi:hypothetical protein
LLGPLFDLMQGRYPSPSEITIDYLRGIRSVVEMGDYPIDENGPLPPDLVNLVTPLDFGGWDLSGQRDPTGWRAPGILLGDVSSFEDLLLFWNLRAADAPFCFYDEAHAGRMKPFVQAFLSSIRAGPPEESRRVNFWSRRATAGRPESWSTDLDTRELQPSLCGGNSPHLWNGLNLRPLRPKFSTWHQDVVPFYAEEDDSARAAFALPDRPFDEDDPHALNQQFVVIVDAEQYGPASDDRTFATPFVPRLNEFYGRNFYFEYDKARAEPGSFGRGAESPICIDLRRYRA